MPHIQICMFIKDISPFSVYSNIYDLKSCALHKPASTCLKYICNVLTKKHGYHFTSWICNHFNTTGIQYFKLFESFIHRIVSCVSELQIINSSNSLSIVCFQISPRHWASSTRLTTMSLFKPRLPAQWAVGTHRKGPQSNGKVICRTKWPFRNSTKYWNQIQLSWKTTP